MDDKNEELIGLIARCALRDQAALKLLYERVAPFLNGLAFRMLKSDDQANDVLQEAFIQIWDNAASYRPHIAKPMTWMASILRYRALDRLDKEQRYDRQLKSAADEYIDEHAESDLANPERSMDANQLDRQITACLGNLSSSMQKSIRMAYLEGFSREEIAGILNTNVNTVKSWLRRGAERLKRCLETKLATAN